MIDSTITFGDQKIDNMTTKPTHMISPRGPYFCCNVEGLIPKKYFNEVLV